MLKLLFPLPKKITVAISGGVDSIAVVDFLRKKHDVTCAYFHHGTDNGEVAMKFVANFCTDNNLPMILGWISSTRGKTESIEEYWRRERYTFLERLGPVITCHHLDDCVETYIWSCFHGNPKVIPFRRNNIIRPFLTTRKKEFVNWCTNKNVNWCHDTSNDDVKYTRNYIRNILMPHALKVNPGLPKVVKRIVEQNLLR